MALNQKIAALTAFTGKIVALTLLIGKNSGVNGVEPGK